MRIPAVVLVFFAADLALVIAYLADYLAGHPIPRLTAFLDLKQEGNLPSWYSSIQWFCVAAALGVFTRDNFKLAPGKSWLLVLLTLVFLALSLDEIAQIHEWVGLKSDSLLPGQSRASSMFRETGIWMFVVGVPFCVVFLGLVISTWIFFRDTPGALVKILVGLAVALGGAVGIEILSNFVTRNSTSAMFQVLAEEMCEMIGSTIVLWGSYLLICGNRSLPWMNRVETSSQAVHEPALAEHRARVVHPATANTMSGHS